MLRFILQPSIWSNLENVPCKLKKNMYSAVLRWKFYRNCVRSSCFILLLKYSTSFSILCSAVTSIIHCGIFKSSTLLLNYQFLPSHISISLCFMYSYSYMTVIFLFTWFIDLFILKYPPLFLSKLIIALYHSFLNYNNCRRKVMSYFFR